MQIALGLTKTAFRPRILGVPEETFHLFLGLVVAPVLALVPFLQLMGWFFQALVHEMGHTAASWLVGVPAIPALGITAEAATVHGDQFLLLTFLAWGALVFGSFRLADGPQRYVALAVVAVLYPILAFTSLRESWQVGAGHFFELIVGGLFLGRALQGGLSHDFTHNQIERGLYSILGWFLIGRNLLLAGGLVGSATARAEYASNGSFGIENDYMRLGELWGTPLQSVGVVMAVLSSLIAPTVVAVWMLKRGESLR